MPEIVMNEVNVVVFTKDDVSTLVNRMAQATPEGERLRAELLGKGLMADEIGKELQTGEGPKTVLARLGVDADTRDTYRLAIVGDGRQKVLLTGDLNPGAQYFDMMSNHGAVKGDDKTATQKLLGDALSGLQTWRALPHLLKIPAHDVVTPGQAGTIGSEGRLTPEEAKKLQRDVTLMVLAEKAKTTTVASTFVPNNRPSGGTTPGRNV
jgi:hypothetical protein